MKKLTKVLLVLLFIYWLPFIFAWWQYEPKTSIKKLAQVETVIVFGTLVKEGRVSALKQYFQILKKLQWLCKNIQQKKAFLKMILFQILKLIIHQILVKMKENFSQIIAHVFLFRKAIIWLILITNVKNRCKGITFSC